MSMRLRRLASDFEKIQTEFAGHKHVKVVPISGNPPEKFRVTYFLKSLRWDDQLNCPVENMKHEVEIYLPQDYPRNKPQCLIYTPIFHPNFSANQQPNIICIGDHWAAGNSLVDVVMQIGEMLQFQTYNVRSPLNAVAARWALVNEKFFPIGQVDLYLPEPEVELIETAPPIPQLDDLEIDLKPAQDNQDGLLEINCK